MGLNSSLICSKVDKSLDKLDKLPIFFGRKVFKCPNGCEMNWIVKGYYFCDCGEKINLNNSRKLEHGLKVESCSLYWEKEFIICENHKESKSIGYYCQKCNFFLCRECVNLDIDPECFEKHLTLWRNNILSFCLKHNGSSYSGFYCMVEGHNSFVCDECFKTKEKYQKGKCLNGHKTIWKNYLNNSNVINCALHKKAVTSGYYCDECDYLFCDECSGNNLKENYQKGQCLNGHKTIWKKLNKGIKCTLHKEVVTSGLYCEQCNDIYCDKCSGTNLINFKTKFG